MTGTTPPLACLHYLHEAVGHAAGPEAIYEAAVKAVCQGLDIGRASLLVTDRDGVMRFRAWISLSDSFRAATEGGPSPWRPDEIDPRPVLVPALWADDEPTPLQDPFQAEGIRAVAVFPLRRSGRFVGKLMAYWDEPHHLPAAEIQLGEVIAGYVGCALDCGRTQALLDAFVQQHPATVDMAQVAAGEGLRGQALAALGIALALLAAIPMFDAIWSRVVVGVLVAIAVFIGAACWWVVPAPPLRAEDGSLANPNNHLRSALAILDGATLWTLYGLIVAALITCIGVLVDEKQAVGLKLGLFLTSLLTAWVAWHWAHSPFVWHGRASKEPWPVATVLYGGRFLMPLLHKLHANLKALRSYELPLIEEEHRRIEQVVSSTNDEEQRALLEELAAHHARHSNLMTIHDRSALPAQDFVDLAERLRHTETLSALWMMPRALLLMIPTFVSAPAWSARANRTDFETNLNKWSQTSTKDFAAKVEKSPSAAMREVAASDYLPAVKLAQIGDLLERWASTRCPSEVEDLERMLDEWFGFPNSDAFLLEDLIPACQNHRCPVHRAANIQDYRIESRLLCRFTANRSVNGSAGAATSVENSAPPH